MKYDIIDAEKLKIINGSDLPYIEIKFLKALSEIVAIYDPKTDTNISGIPVAEQSLAEYKNTDIYSSFSTPEFIEGDGTIT